MKNEINENGQGPRKDTYNPKDNKYGHQYGSGRLEDNGYGRCKWCGCRENTKDSIIVCPRAEISLNSKWVYKEK